MLGELRRSQENPSLPETLHAPLLVLWARRRPAPFRTTPFVVDTEDTEAAYVSTATRISLMSLLVLVSCSPVLSWTGVLGWSRHPPWEPESPRLALSELGAYGWWDSLYHRMVPVGDRYG